MRAIQFLGSIIILSLLGSACQGDRELYPEEKKMAELYCQSCHLLPDPKDLDFQTWKTEVLPNMGQRLGLYFNKEEQLKLLLQADLFPHPAVLKDEEWAQIVRYYLANAPKTDSPLGDKHRLSKRVEQFEPKTLPLPTIPFITLLHWDSSQHRLIYGNGVEKKLGIWPSHEGVEEGLSIEVAPTAIILGEAEVVVLGAGKLNPHEGKFGTLGIHALSKDGRFGASQLLIQDLPRPVHAISEDLDGDQLKDIVISCFGHYSGELIWYSNYRSAERKKHVLRPLPGAIKTEIWDFNRDGRPDILALMAQGQEGFFLYENKGAGQFEESILLEFPPTYGSAYFEMLDYNGDGHEDILYVNGDNGDYLPIRKDYHGIRLYLNNGQNKFDLHFFLAQHGAFKAKVNDFDQDGDPDIAAISHFPDYKDRAEEGFVYYENIGNSQFQARTFPNSGLGKWLTMDIGDTDQDGDMDILLGSAVFVRLDVPEKLRQQWKDNGVSVLLLENQLNPKSN